MNEALDDYDLVEAAYANIIVNKIMLAGRQNKRGFNRKKFSEEVDNYYNAAKIEHGEKYRWCHILATQCCIRYSISSIFSVSFVNIDSKTYNFDMYREY